MLFLFSFLYYDFTLYFVIFNKFLIIYFFFHIISINNKNRYFLLLFAYFRNGSTFFYIIVYFNLKFIFFYLIYSFQHLVVFPLNDLHLIINFNIVLFNFSPTQNQKYRRQK